MTELTYQELLDKLPPVEPPSYPRLLAAIGVAFSDALGQHGAQPELASRWELERDRGCRLQVVGHIDLKTLERVLAGRVLDIIRDHLADPKGIADVIRQHVVHPPTQRCTCGERGITDPAMHFAWVLRERFTIPPETFDDL